MKNTLNKQQLILEFFSVVFAVILALLLNGWRESVALNANLEKVEISVLNEARTNQKRIRSSNDYRKKLIQRLYSNQNILLSVPLNELDFDAQDNQKLEAFFRTGLIFGQKEYHDKVAVLQDEDARVLVLDEKVYDIKIENEQLKVLGIGNIELQLPDLNNQSWDLVKATGTATRMEIGVVENLITVSTLIDTYQKTCNSALQMVYNGEFKGLIPVLEDLLNQEEKIIKSNDDLIVQLKESKN